MAAAPDVEESTLELSQLRVDGRVERRARCPPHTSSLRIRERPDRGRDACGWSYGRLVGAGVTDGRGDGCWDGPPGEPDPEGTGVSFGAKPQTDQLKRPYVYLPTFAAHAL